MNAIFAAVGGAVAGAAAAQRQQAEIQNAIASQNSISKLGVGLPPRTKRVMQRRAQYEIAEEGEVRVSMTWQDGSCSVPEAIEYYRPPGCEFLSFTLDYYHSFIRLLYVELEQP